MSDANAFSANNKLAASAVRLYDIMDINNHSGERPPSSNNVSQYTLSLSSRPSRSFGSFVFVFSDPLWLFLLHSCLFNGGCMCFVYICSVYLDTAV